VRGRGRDGGRRRVARGSGAAWRLWPLGPDPPRGQASWCVLLCPGVRGRASTIHANSPARGRGRRTSGRLRTRRTAPWFCCVKKRGQYCLIAPAPALVAGCRRSGAGQGRSAGLGARGLGVWRGERESDSGETASERCRSDLLLTPPKVRRPRPRPTPATHTRIPCVCARSLPPCPSTSSSAWPARPSRPRPGPTC